jgi:NAD(P)H-hydrate epimerase
METLVTMQTMETIDAQSIHQFSIPGVLLMEHAGVKGFQTFYAHYKNSFRLDQKIVVVAGGGNNGGDALVMAREAYLVGFTNLSLLLLGSHISQSCALHRTICEGLAFDQHTVKFDEQGSIDQKSESILSSAHLIIDGYLGTGLRGSLQPSAKTMIEVMNRCHEKGSFILSVDVPSGCSDSISVNQHQVLCDVCITFGLKKGAMYHPVRRKSWKKLFTINPSFPLHLLRDAPQSALLASLDDIHIPKIEETSYKNARGHIALFGGSETFSGAPHLTSKAAFHSGSGLVSLFCDESVALTFKQEQPSLIVHSLSQGEIVRAKELVDKYDVIAVGPGWSDNREEQMLELVKSKIPLVCDADGIRTFANLVHSHRLSATDHGPMILTPHPGEIQKMLEILSMPLLSQEIGMLGTSESFIESLQKFARLYHVVLVYKSHVVWIFDGTVEDSIPIVVDGNNSALGVAGSGDVLTGIITSMLCSENSIVDAALQGVLIHQKAGKIARDSHRWFDSESLLDYIGDAMNEGNR